MAHSTSHKWSSRKRSKDVKADVQIRFAHMMLDPQVMLGLKKESFTICSPIQQRAIPLGRSGLDLLIQAKSGTGKTLAFAIIMLEAYNPAVAGPQSLIIVPTREIAVQIETSIRRLAQFIPHYQIESFIGGMDVTEDRRKIQGCKALVGTPGRILHLITNCVLKTSDIRLLVLDEADQLMSSSFRNDIRCIQKKLPKKIQTLAVSATFGDVDVELSKMMNNPVGVTPCREIPILLGVKQFAYVITDDPNETPSTMQDQRAKVKAMYKIFSTLPFKQCLIFSNSQSRAESYCNYLKQDGWPAEVIMGSQSQPMRLDIFKRFKMFQFRNLVATDLMARGIDSENVNVVINLEVPIDATSYLHRIGRAGRFGSNGISITLLGSHKELKHFRYMLGTLQSKLFVYKYPTHADPDEDIWQYDTVDIRQKIIAMSEAEMQQECKSIKGWKASKLKEANIVEEDEQQQQQQRVGRGKKRSNSSSNDVLLKDVDAEEWDVLEENNLTIMNSQTEQFDSMIEIGADSQMVKDSEPEISKEDDSQRDIAFELIWQKLSRQIDGGNDVNIPDDMWGIDEKRLGDKEEPVVIEFPSSNSFEMFNSTGVPRIGTQIPLTLQHQQQQPELNMTSKAKEVHSHVIEDDVCKVESQTNDKDITLQAYDDRNTDNVSVGSHEAVECNNPKSDEEQSNAIQEENNIEQQISNEQPENLNEITENERNEVPEQLDDISEHLYTISASINDDSNGASVDLNTISGFSSDVLEQTNEVANRLNEATSNEIPKIQNSISKSSQNVLPINPDTSNEVSEQTSDHHIITEDNHEFAKEVPDPIKLLHPEKSYKQLEEQSEQPIKHSDPNPTQPINTDPEASEQESEKPIEIIEKHIIDAVHLNESSFKLPIQLPVIQDNLSDINEKTKDTIPSDSEDESIICDSDTDTIELDVKPMTPNDVLNFLSTTDDLMFEQEDVNDVKIQNNLCDIVENGSDETSFQESHENPSDTASHLDLNEQPTDAMKYVLETEIMKSYKENIPPNPESKVKPQSATDSLIHQICNINQDSTDDDNIVEQIPDFTNTKLMNTNVTNKYANDTEPSTTFASRNTFCTQQVPELKLSLDRHVNGCDDDSDFVTTAAANNESDGEILLQELETPKSMLNNLMLQLTDDSKAANQMGHFDSFDNFFSEISGISNSNQTDKGIASHTDEASPPSDETNSSSNISSNTQKPSTEIIFDASNKTITTVPEVIDSTGSLDRNFQESSDFLTEPSSNFESINDSSEVTTSADEKYSGSESDSDSDEYMSTNNKSNNNISRKPANLPLQQNYNTKTIGSGQLEVMIPSDDDVETDDEGDEVQSNYSNAVGEMYAAGASSAAPTNSNVGRINAQMLRRHASWNQMHLNQLEHIQNYVQYTMESIRDYRV